MFCSRYARAVYAATRVGRGGGPSAIREGLKMDACEPRARHRGFFLHSDTTGEPGGEMENPEGFVVRVRRSKPASRRHTGGISRSGGRSGASTRAEDDSPQIRSGSVTGSRQRAHLPR